MLRSRRLWAPYVVPAVTLLFAMQVVPIVHGLSLSFFDAGPRHTQWAGFANFKTMFGTRLFWTGVKNTLAFTAVSAPILIILTFGIAVVAYGMKRHMQWFVRFTFYLPQIISSAVLSLIWIWIFNPDGALNSLILSFNGERLNWLGSNPLAFWSVTIVLITQGLGIPIVVFLGALTSVDSSLYESAAIDGCGRIRQALHVTLPIIFPVFTMQVATVLIGSMQIWALPYWMTGGGPAYGTYTLVLGMYREMAMFSDYGTSAAYAVVTTLALTAMILGQKRLSRCFQ